jgi:hypothetical protein
VPGVRTVIVEPGLAVTVAVVAVVAVAADKQ